MLYNSKMESFNIFTIETTFPFIKLCWRVRLASQYKNEIFSWRDLTFQFMLWKNLKVHKKSTKDYYYVNSFIWMKLYTYLNILHLKVNGFLQNCYTNPHHYLIEIWKFTENPFTLKTKQNYFPYSTELVIMTDCFEKSLRITLTFLRSLLSNGFRMHHSFFNHNCRQCLKFYIEWEILCNVRLQTLKTNWNINGSWQFLNLLSKNWKGLDNALSWWAAAQQNHHQHSGFRRKRHS